ncbi:Predicted amidohydrolase [Arboricoccus pini]|uniref:Predicted amidohydrolase n=1 Tax=Arboricoccus pini TaxID=1963835 RepID=A0A212Q0S5_9PROT|nr:nitrilase-related carbon-nitrogen hydrolase [Arboricoccus pini]SNB52906.1 Predicted amidohydrolase [Arboricoccus pini]
MSTTKQRTPGDLTVALWAMNMGLAPASAEAFIETAKTEMRAARARQADIMVMPEYVCESWLTFAPAGLAETAEIAWMAEVAQAILPELAREAARLDMLLVAGTVPVAVDQGYRNRAWIFTPEGQVLAQDKLSLTPDERDPEAWTLVPGDEVTLITWRGRRLAVVICLDIEQPALGARLQGLDIDLILNPSDTGRLSGHSRVFSCAKARAVELFCAVAPVGGVGPVPVQGERGNVSGAAIYLPCEAAFGHTGILAEQPAADRTEGAGRCLIARVPLRALHAARKAGGEVWLGAWSAESLRLNEPPICPN